MGEAEKEEETEDQRTKMWSQKQTGELWVKAGQWLRGGGDEDGGRWLKPIHSQQLDQRQGRDRRCECG